MLVRDGQNTISSAGKFRGFRVAFLGFAMMFTVPLIASKILDLASRNTEENRTLSFPGSPRCTILDSRDIEGDRFLFVEVSNEAKYGPMLIHRPTGAETYLKTKDGKLKKTTDGKLEVASSQIETWESGDSLYMIINPGEMRWIRIRIPAEIVGNAGSTTIRTVKGPSPDCTEPVFDRWYQNP